MKAPLSAIGLRQRLPVILQTEVSECGLTCLAMIANYYGNKIDLASLRRRFSISTQGATLESLVLITQHIGLESRPVRAELESLKDLKLPCVIHWDMNHFVVLKSVSKRHIVIHDPASGPRKISIKDASKSYTGIALELSPTADYTAPKPEPKISLKKMIGKAIGLKRSLIQILILAIAIEIIAIAMPFQLQWVVDRVLLNADAELLTVIGIGFILLIAIQVIISTVRSWLVVTLSTNLNYQWMGNVFGHLLRLPLDYFVKRHIGHISSCFDSLDHIQETLTFNFIQTIVDGLLVIGTLVVMFLYSPKLTLIALVAVLLYLIIKIGVYKALRDATAEEIIHRAKQHTHFVETTMGIQSVRLFNKSNERRIGWMNMVANQFNAKLRVYRINITYEFANNIIFGIERCLVVWLAAVMVLNSSFTLGMLFAFLAYKEQFSSRVSTLIDSLFQLKMLRLHLDRLSDIIGTEPEKNGAEYVIDGAKIRTNIEVKNLYYRYSPISEDIISGLNLSINEGECVAITGASGCGKTTLIKLMLGLLTPSSGEILLDNKAISQIGGDQYRSLVATVMQEDRLFTGSIADNISFFSSDRDNDFIIKCAQLAAIEQDILEMPMAYNTLVGDTGVGISGGQKQRILLARALYKKPRILVLDEATSQLDIENEYKVNDSIKKMDLTRIIIAHRPQTIAMADRVIHIENGIARTIPPKETSHKKTITMA